MAVVVAINSSCMLRILESWDKVLVERQQALCAVAMANETTTKTNVTLFLRITFLLLPTSWPLSFISPIVRLFRHQLWHWLCIGLPAVPQSWHKNLVNCHLAMSSWTTCVKLRWNSTWNAQSLQASYLADSRVSGDQMFWKGTKRLGDRPHTQ